jgi:hypothetical protein
VTDPQLPPPVSKTAPDTQHPTNVVPLEVTDVDGDRIRFRLAPGAPDPVLIETAGPVDADDPDWRLRVNITRDQVLQLIGWFGHALNLAPCHLPHGQHLKAMEQHPATFTIRPAGEDENVTVALRNLGPCPICGNDVRAGFFAVAVDDGPPFRKAWVHESCARPGQPPRPPLNADPTRNRT